MSEKMPPSDLDPVVQDVLDGLLKRFNKPLKKTRLIVHGSPEGISRPVSLEVMSRLLSRAVKRHYVELVDMNAADPATFHEERFLRIVDELTRLIKEHFENLTKGDGKDLVLLCKDISEYILPLIVIKDKAYDDEGNVTNVQFAIEHPQKYKILTLLSMALSGVDDKRT